jgi:16S rRNA (guanine527-N7)-methyltransferase
MLVYYSNMDQYSKQINSVLGISLSDKQIEQFLLFETLLIEWNQKFNLTAIRSSEEIQRKHFLDSLYCALAWKNMNPPRSCIDIGTGAGFPGIVLSILFPLMEITLVESTQKKVTFCQYVIQQLELKNCVAIQARAEELSRNSQYISSYDCVVSRAVATLPKLVTYMLPFAKKNGLIVAMKGINVEQEMLNIDVMLKKEHGKIINIIGYVLPQEQEERKLVIIQKMI